MESKKWYESRTVWFNILSFSAAALLLLAGSPLLIDYAGWLMLGNALVNLGLRFLTTEAITPPNNLPGKKSTEEQSTNQ